MLCYIRIFCACSLREHLHREKDAASSYDPSCENAMPGDPQTARHCSVKIIFPLFMPKANAAGILICYILIFCAARAMDASSATRRFSSIWPQ